MTRSEKIQQILTAALNPTYLKVFDESHLHAGHAGALTGKGYFTVQIASPQFADKTRVERHRLVNQALTDLFETDIHALSIKILDVPPLPLAGEGWGEGKL